MFKKILFPLVALFMLAGCAKPPTTIEVSPTITLPQQDPSLMGVTVSINGADQRTDQALAKVTRDNQIVTLTASRDLRFLLQEVLFNPRTPAQVENIRLELKQLLEIITNKDAEGMKRYLTKIREKIK